MTCSLAVAAPSSVSSLPDSSEVSASVVSVEALSSVGAQPTSPIAVITPTQERSAFLVTRMVGPFRR